MMLLCLSTLLNILWRASLSLGQAVPGEGVLLFEDNFDSFDGLTWTRTLGDGSDLGLPGFGNSELSWYEDEGENLYVEDGLLNIRAKYDWKDASPYSSAKITTKTAFAFRYGRVEARIKFPDAGCQGLWAAFWMLPQRSIYGPWPLSGEIDVVEAANDMTTASGAIHYGRDGTSYAWFQGHSTASDPEDFHVWELEWDEGGFEWRKDGVVFGQSTHWDAPVNTESQTAPFDQDFTLIFNLAIGGEQTVFTGNAPADSRCISIKEPVMQVDYVRVYSKYPEDQVPGCGELLGVPGDCKKCNRNGVCDGLETCTSCASDCGTCDELEYRSAVLLEQTSCLDPYDFPEVAWKYPTATGDAGASSEEEGYFRGSLVYSPLLLEDAESGLTMRTRSFHGTISGPIIRVQACKTYSLQLENHVFGYPSRRVGMAGTPSEPSTTNVYLRGINVQGERKTKDIAPGEHDTIVFTVACDHSGGTHLYHPLFPGNSLLQIGSGSAGMLIVDDSSLIDEPGRPKEYSEMKEAIMFINYMNPRDIQHAVDAHGDELFAVSSKSPFVLVNGCSHLELPMPSNQWTRIRLAMTGSEQPFFLDIVADDGTPPCDIQLLAKDGVYLAQTPRALPKSRIFLLPFSRVDVAIRCPFSGMHRLDLVDPSTALVEFESVASIKVVASHLDPSVETIPHWKPQRPGYLVDLSGDASGLQARSLAVDSENGTVGGRKWWESRECASMLDLNEVNDCIYWKLIANGEYMITVEGTEIVQLFGFQGQLTLKQIGTQDSQSAAPDQWYLPGDWTDTIYSPSVESILVRVPYYSGRGQLAIGGLAAEMDRGAFQLVDAIRESDSNSLIAPKRYFVPSVADSSGRKPETFLKDSKGWIIPGVIEAQYFDYGGPGVSYYASSSSKTWDHRAPNLGIFRSEEHLHLSSDSQFWKSMSTNHYIDRSQPGDWASYTVHVQASGSYNLRVLVGNFHPIVDGELSLWWDSEAGCELGREDQGSLLVRVSVAPQSSWHFFPHVNAGNFTFTEGSHSFTVCHGSRSVALDAFIFYPTDREEGDMAGYFWDIARNADWSGSPRAVPINYPPPGDTLPAAGIAASDRNLRGPLISDNLEDEMKELLTVSDVLQIFCTMKEHGICEKMLDQMLAMDVMVHFTVALEPNELENYRSVTALAALAARYLNSSLKIQAFILGEVPALNTNNMHHIQKLAQHASAQLHAFGGGSIPVGVYEDAFTQVDSGLWKHVDVMYLAFDRKKVNNPLLAASAALDSYIYASKVPRPIFLGQLGWDSSSVDLMLTEVDADSEALNREQFFKDFIVLSFEHWSKTQQIVAWGLTKAYTPGEAGYSALGAGFLALPWYYVFINIGIAVLCTFLALLGICASWRMRKAAKEAVREKACFDLDAKETGMVTEVGTSALINDVVAEAWKAVIHRSRKFVKLDVPIRGSSTPLLSLISVLTVLVVLAFAAVIAHSMFARFDSAIPAIILSILVNVWTVPLILYPVLAGVKNVLYVLLPGGDASLYKNSMYYSAEKESIPKDAEPFSVSIMMPIYREGIEDVILPSLESVAKAMKNFARQGGSCNLLVADDGLQTFNEEEQNHRKAFYAGFAKKWKIKMSFVARPPSSVRVRRGAFKKASNLNYLHMVIDLVERYRISHPDLGEHDLLQGALASLDHKCDAEGDLKLYDLVLLIDSDTRIPKDCLMDVQGEFLREPNLGFLQCRTTPLLMSDSSNCITSLIAYLTSTIWDQAIGLDTAWGGASPLIGHNAFLRKSALRAAEEVLRLDSRVANCPGEAQIWSEEHVSEDFEMMLRLHVCGYFGRYATYCGSDFKEGFPLTAAEDVVRQARFAYGAFEVLFSHPGDWLRLGPFSPIIKHFLSSDLPWETKLATAAYLINFFGKAVAYPSILLLLVLIALPEIHGMSNAFVDPMMVLVTTAFVFMVTGFLASLKFRVVHSLGEVSMVRLLVCSWEVLWNSSFLGSLYHATTLLDATIMAAQFFLRRKNQSVYFPDTTKGMHGKNFFQQVAGEMVTKVKVNSLLAATSILAAASAYILMSSGRVDRGDSGLSGGIRSEFVYMSWWWFAVTQALIPIFFVVLQHATNRTLKEEKRHHQTFFFPAPDKEGSNDPIGI